MTGGKTNDWRGKVQPKRDRCPKCGKRGLGKIKSSEPIEQGSRRLVLEYPYQECRYCGHIQTVERGTNK